MSFIEVRVVETRGSTPRGPGTRMWVGAGETRGTIGGGNLEYIALEIAREMLASGETERQRRFVLGDSLGQCCGGNTTLAFKRVETMEGEVGLFDVVLFGAGHVGKEVARILERVPCRLTWVDARREQFPEHTTARIVVDDEPAFAVDEAAAGAFYLIMTHSHALDFEIVERALLRKDASFVGMIGSETKAAKLRARLRARGVDASRLVSPIGLFKAGKHPAEVAVSAVAQLLQLRQEAGEKSTA
ncbi:MAG TPA: xanthine dehydrogenase accessory protein XdhC [Burkholderiales bacterium]|nr:xanthine dehydrogenase accessory protein XdhC [Burkholderiales bacterium]